MKTFTDNANRTWTVSITVDSIKRVKGLLAVNLLDAVGGDLLEKLVGDPVLLCDVVYALCKPQADQAGVGDEDFGRSMAGDAIERATTALLEDLVDFFPGQRRKLLAKALDKMRAMEAVAFQVAEARLDDPALEAQIRSAASGSSG
ncbi:MAG: hypothetical protein BWX88_05107 [Planctomycetes bacterium ADurb.Bin126]|nr:MAG: hypothetical protein BWX88_05107 [Planctomycetes bacterium ADurb.Bin126]HOD83737.1 hypothetical protein [Phycisphaerae bacterium]HQL76347.1 hypothetical protein [Phycisphaerae bacterium]